MRKFLLKAAVLSTALMMTVSCLHAAPSEEELLGVAAALTKVSAPLHSAVRYKNPDPSLHDAALLDFATTHNPALLTRFEGYLLKARQIGKNSSVLVCDSSGTVAYIEDAGCTGKLDLHLWQTQPEQPCEYVLDLTAVCP